MYTDEVLSISKADNGGFILSVRVRRKKTKESKGELCCGPMNTRNLVASDIEEVKNILDEVLPNIKEGGMEEDEFNKAFKEAVEED